MKKLVIIAFAGLMLCAGVLFFLVQGDYLIIKLPTFSYPSLSSGKAVRSSDAGHELNCFVWGRGSMRQVKKNILWSQDAATTIKRISAAWLQVASEEAGVADDVKIQSVALTSQGTVALISFDKLFIPAELSTADRWRLVESLLQTLRTAGVVLEAVYFLRANSCMTDDYLDFSTRWPIGGYQG
jgi:hypothetical protein